MKQPGFSSRGLTKRELTGKTPRDILIRDVYDVYRIRKLLSMSCLLLIVSYLKAYFWPSFIFAKASIGTLKGR